MLTWLPAMFGSKHANLAAWEWLTDCGEVPRWRGELEDGGRGMKVKEGGMGEKREGGGGEGEEGKGKKRMV